MKVPPPDCESLVDDSFLTGSEGCKVCIVSSVNRRNSFNCKKLVIVSIFWKENIWELKNMNCFRRASGDLHCLVTWFSTPLSPPLNLFPGPQILWFQNSRFDITTASMMKSTSVLLGSTMFAHGGSKWAEWRTSLCLYILFSCCCYLVTKSRTTLLWPHGL